MKIPRGIFRGNNGSVPAEGLSSERMGAILDAANQGLGDLTSHDIREGVLAQKTDPRTTTFTAQQLGAFAANTSDKPPTYHTPSTHLKN